MNIYKGIGVSEGISIGKVLKINSAFMSYPRIELQGNEEKISLELDKIRMAQKAVEEQLDQILDQSDDFMSKEMEPLLVGYKMFIRDKRFIPAIEKTIQESKINAEWALIRVIADLDKQFKKIQDPYIRARFDDIRQLGERLMSQLQKTPHLDLSQLQQPVILICHDISPADSFQIVKANILGIVTELGGAASHSAILARAMNIPAVLGVNNILMRLLDDDLTILDGTTGEVIVHPDDETINEKLEKIERISFRQNELQKLVETDCVLSDGTFVDLAANLDFLTELQIIKSLNIASIGLIRTEFLFLIEDTLPDEDQQFELYEQIVKEIDYKPITIRTWDVGGDKPTGIFPELQNEANPALGLRAIRVCLKHEDVFRVQIRAIIRASEICQINLLLPMVTRLDEVVRTIALVREEQENLGIFSKDLKIGCMIETPASVFIIDEMLDLIDFVSIGSNDLIQYALAVDRMNDQVADMFTPFHPAILKMLENIVLSANRMNKAVSICGELAADPIFQMFLLGVGQVTFSMNPSHVLKTKSVLKKVDTATCKKIAFQFMNKHSYIESHQYDQQLRDQFLGDLVI
jgi:phosphoenolpyruvate-protein phosphotransferase (PTS system enzyme I)